MTQLVNDVTARGLLYCDWNVSSGDANSKPISTEQVVQNVISGVQSHNVSVVLQHDIKDFSVNAVEQIIQWGQANGYTFLTTHHKLTDVSSSHKQLKHQNNKKAQKRRVQNELFFFNH